MGQHQVRCGAVLIKLTMSNEHVVVGFHADGDYDQGHMHENLKLW